MNSNKYLINTFTKKCKEIEDKEEQSESDKKTVEHYRRYIRFLNGVNYKVTLENQSKAITPQNPPHYWGTALYVGHCLLKGSKGSYYTMMNEMGYNYNLESNDDENSKNKNKKNKKSKKKGRVRFKKNAKRKIQTNKLKKAKQQSKPKQPLFTDSSNAFAKFKKKYMKLKPHKIKNKSYAPRPQAIQNNLNLCSIIDDDEDNEDDTDNNNDNEKAIKRVLSRVAQPLKINIGACYIDQELRPKATGTIERDELKDLLPIIFNGTFNIKKPTINYVSSYLILKLISSDDSNEFKINSNFIKLFNEWKNWTHNNFHAIIMKEINKLKEGSASSSECSDFESDSENLQDKIEIEETTNNTIESENSEDESEVYDEENEANDKIDINSSEEVIKLEFDDLIMYIKCNNINDKQVCADLDTALDVGSELYDEYKKCRRLKLFYNEPLKLGMELQTTAKMILNKTYSILHRNKIVFDVAEKKIKS